MQKRKSATIRCDASGLITHQDRQAQAWFGDRVGQELAGLFTGAGPGELVPVRPGETVEATTEDGPLPVHVGASIKKGTLQIHLVDATADVHAHQRTRESERQLKEAQATAGVGSWEWDIVADAITWTDELYRIYGLEPQSFPATFEAYIERIHPEDKELALGVVQNAFETAEAFSFDHRIVRADNEEVRWLHGQGTVETEGGKPVRMYGVSQDITETRLAEEARAEAKEREAEIAHLKQLEAERRRLLNTMAHELKTPLTPLSLQVQLLEGQRFGPLTPDQAKSVHILEQNLSRLQALVSDILDNARMDEGRLHLHRSESDLVVLADEATQTFIPQAEAQGVSIRFRAPPEPLVADVDPHRITQVLYNLLSNALKFTPEGGQVTLQVAPQEEGACIRVQDNGAGLDEAQIGRLFRPFAQVHEDREAAGTGLGLHICKGIIEQHGGSITCSSKGHGKGTTFDVLLPAAAPLQHA